MVYFRNIFTEEEKEKKEKKMRMIKKKKLIQSLMVFVVICCFFQLVSFYKLNFPSEQKPISWIEDGKQISTTHYYIAYEDDVQLLRLELFLFLFCFGLVIVLIFQEYQNLIDYIDKLNEEEK